MIVVVIDTETTGLTISKAAAVSKQPKPIEFYAQPIVREQEGWGEHPPTHLLFDPEEPLEPIITKITGFRDKDLKGKPKFHECIAQVRQVIESADIVVAHNLTFDMDILDYAFERAEAEPIVWPRGICTVEATEHLFGTRMSLSNLYLHLFNETFKAHRASNDVDALVRVFRQLCLIGEIEI